MNKIRQMWRVATHPRELRMAISGLGVRIGGDTALGGLTDEETSGIAEWVKRASGGAGLAEGKKPVFVEIGTLFGFTAKAVAQRTGVRVVAVDNFCWNPFGLTSEEHERFTRKVIEGCAVELVRDDAKRFLAAIGEPGGTVDAESALVFLDGDHRYEAVKEELEILKAKGVRHVAGHDFGNPNFGVTRAVREVVGEPDEVVGMCWTKTL